MDSKEQNTRPVRTSRWRTLMIGIAGPLAAVALTAAVAQAHGGGGFGPGDMHDRMAMGMRRVLDGVNATDAQKAQIKQAWEGLRPQLKAARTEHQQLRQQITQA